jgi:hypothetical protein
VKCETLELWLKYPSKTQEFWDKIRHLRPGRYQGRLERFWAHRNSVDSIRKSVRMQVVSGTPQTASGRYVLLPGAFFSFLVALARVRACRMTPILYF